MALSHRTVLLLAALCACTSSSETLPAGSPDARPTADASLTAVDAAPANDGPAGVVLDARPGVDARPAVDGGGQTSCNSNEDLCDGTCLPRTSTGNCHGGCTVCPTPDNGLPTCDGLTCSVSCSVGFHQCGAQCLADDSTASCGARCAPC